MTTSGGTNASSLPPTSLPPPSAVTSASETDGNKETKETNVGVIVGSVFAGLAVTIVAGVLICLRRRNERQRKLYELPPYDQPSMRAIRRYPVAYSERGTDVTISRYDIHSVSTDDSPAVNTSVRVAASRVSPTEQSTSDSPPQYHPFPDHVVFQEPRKA
ncbi:uncharacterized protein FOMMEDRAFT_159346 [Fomitiporia mediterranea MF3/22]|uniref:uncharacterized protein n=1 Tax=Fomitiporia mediterranea (strain MF3/22) TaxID=694068 RepID=UPI0004409664|nr:uncharacterized protein FOMMEDRAFT_159346 [Fomitiporia mediterranea MF3/22]EJD00598.1 hypothetical protein FOMMEDRAFT_159346 [Fomitiporia mediterranea MF3/22]